MKILMSHMPKSGWWGKGTPVYKNNVLMKKGRIPDALLTKKEHTKVIASLKRTAELEIIPFPSILDSDQLYKHDAVFVRDSFISNQQGTIIIANYAAKERQVETAYLKQHLKTLGYRILTLSQTAHAEGGEFYYIKEDNILFAGLCRNNKKGVAETAKHLSVTDVCIVKTNSFHVDTVCTVLLDTKGKFIGIIACLSVILNRDTLISFAKKRKIPLFEVMPIDSITIDGTGTIAVNCLPLPGVLVGGGKFLTPGIEEHLKKMGIEHIITPVSQFHVSGGGVHCLTNELTFE